jgi:protein phosphatase
MTTHFVPGSAARFALYAPSGRPALVVQLGCATGAPSGKPNEDYFGVAGSRTAGAGVVIALADGVSSDGHGRLASETAVRSLLQDFGATPASWSTALALEKLLTATNDWLASENRRRSSLEGAVAAMSVLVVEHDGYHLGHVGDTRIYRSRGRSLEQLTTDHTWPRRDMRHVLKRALGLDSHIVVDFARGALHAGDVFVLVSDGVWDVLGDEQIAAALRELSDPQLAAAQLVRQALAHQAAYIGRNDATAIVAAIRAA